MEFNFVEINSDYYQQGLKIREQLFFANFVNAQELLNDEYEQESIHLVAKHKERVLGTGRLTIIKNKAIISQMTVLLKFQKQNVGKQLLSCLLEKAISLNSTTVELSARLTALDFYKKSGFLPVGEVYASVKTGISHQNMIMNLVPKS